MLTKRYIFYKDIAPYEQGQIKPLPTSYREDKTKIPRKIFQLIKIFSIS